MRKAAGASGTPQRQSRRLPVLYVEVVGSRRLGWILACLHAAAVAALVVASIPVGAKVVSVAAIFWAGIKGILRHALRVGPDACVALRFRQAGRCEVVCRDGRSLEGEVHGDSYVLPGLTILRILQHGRPRSLTVVLLADAASPDAMRRLRVRLRLTGDDRGKQFTHDLSL